MNTEYIMPLLGVSFIFLMRFFRLRDSYGMRLTLTLVIWVLVLFAGLFGASEESVAVGLGVGVVVFSLPSSRESWREVGLGVVRFIYRLLVILSLVAAGLFALWFYLIKS